VIKTFGLTHIALAVRDIERSLSFYRQVFGVEPYFREEGRIHVRTPDCHDVITFDQYSSAEAPGTPGGVMHFGFRLQSPSAIDAAVEQATRAGGTLKSRGEFAPGVPYAFVADPDGYLVEIWYE
jgi:catechol 2,3-dioxygenase-like lactoylglutathione lyase family enzyme